MTIPFSIFSQSFPPVSKLALFFETHPKLAIAFSGGCDSAFLLCAAVQAHVDVSTYIIRSPFQPEFEFKDALDVTQKLGISLTPIDIDILKIQEIVQNPANRCYLCKRAIFSKIIEQAHIDGYDTICDGTNASDDIDERPGFKALQEFGVLSPLRTAGFDKALIRHLSALTGLSTAAKPAYACLATRFSANTPLTADNLKQVEIAEKRLKELGFVDFRVRVFHEAARLQFKATDWNKAMEMREQIRSNLADLFDMVFIDTEIR